ncbi:UNVERIFIED_ORG: multiple sugar transport system substrate-binding protein [Martelella mediterranea]
MPVNRYGLYTGPAMPRRALLKGAAALGTLAAFGGSKALAQSDAVRFAINGSADKLRIRGESVALFAETHPEIPVVFEGTPSAAYPDKMTAMIAGGDAPDVFATGPADLAQYGTRGVIKPLDEFVPDIIHADRYAPSVLDLGRIDGKLYGLPIAVSTQCMGYNQTALEQLGMELPAEGFTYESFGEFCAEIHKADNSLYGCQDGGAFLWDFIRKLRSEDRVLVENNKLAVSVDDVAEWLNFWEEMRKTGAAVPADVQAAYGFGEWTNAPMVLGKALFATMFTQDLKSGMQALTEDELAMMAPPGWGTAQNNGCYPLPSSSLSMSAASRLQDNAAFVMDWFCTSPESGRILGLISGPPASNTQLAAVKELPTLDRLDRNVLDYTETALATAKPAPPASRAENVLRDLMKKVNEDVGFGRSSPKEAAEEFVKRGNSAIRRA